MYNTTTSITLLITLLFMSECISWLFMSESAGIPAGSWVVHWSAYPAYKIHSYKHLNLLVILLFTCKMASGSPAITTRMFNNLLLRAICN